MKHLGVLFLFLLTAGVGTAVYLTKQPNILGFNTPLTKLLLILIVVIIANVATKIGIWLLQRYAKAKDKGELKQVTSVYRYVVFIILVLTVMVLLYGIIGPAITSIGLLAAGLTLALQRPLLNLAGWFSIVAKRPFKIGDRVDIGNVGGYVHEIALMHTHLSLVENNEQTGKVVYVPNEQVLTQSIVNYMKGTPLIWEKVRIRVPSAANLNRVEKKLLDCVEAVVSREMGAASRHWKTEVKPETRVAIDYSAGSPLQSYLEITARYLCDTKAAQDVKTQITKKIISKFKKELK